MLNFYFNLRDVTADALTLFQPGWADSALPSQRLHPKFPHGYISESNDVSLTSFFTLSILCVGLSFRRNHSALGWLAKIKFILASWILKTSLDLMKTKRKKGLKKKLNDWIFQKIAFSNQPLHRIKFLMEFLVVLN